MNQKPKLHSIVIINLINNIPMAIVMSTAAPLLSGMPMTLSSWAVNVMLAFILACMINIVIPVPLVAGGFARMLKLEPENVSGRIAGNIPVCLIFVLVIGLILTYYNVRMVPAFIFAFLGTFLPLYLICFAVSMITNPIAMKLAFDGLKE